MLTRPQILLSEVFKNISCRKRNIVMHTQEEAIRPVTSRLIKWLKLWQTFSSQSCIHSNNLQVLYLDNILLTPPSLTLQLHHTTHSTLSTLSYYLSLLFHVCLNSNFRLSPVTSRNTTKIPARSSVCWCVFLCPSYNPKSTLLRKKHLQPFLFILSGAYADGCSYYGSTNSIKTLNNTFFFLIWLASYLPLYA